MVFWLLLASGRLATVSENDTSTLSPLLLTDLTKVLHAATLVPVGLAFMAVGCGSVAQ
jgi:hypothetical protein